MLKRRSSPGERCVRRAGPQQPRMRSSALFDAERLQLPMQRRALHADELGGSRYVAAEAADLGDQIVALEGFPSGIGGEKLLSLPLREAREAFERDYLVAQISRFGGNISRTAEFIGMERSALHRKLKSLGVE